MPVTINPLGPPFDFTGAGGGAPGPTGPAGPAGPPGFDGEQGEQGESFVIPGPTGSAGATGAQGLQGPFGPPGFDGSDGEDSFIPGPQGPPGSGSGSGLQAAQVIVHPSTSTDSTQTTNGSADEVEINAAITGLPAGGGRVLLREGTYTLAAPVVIAKSNVILQGQGAATVLALGNGVNNDAIQLGDGVASYTAITVCDLAIDGNMANQTAGRGINITTGVSQSAVRRTKISNTYSHNIGESSSGNNDIAITDNYLDTVSTAHSGCNVFLLGSRTIVSRNVCLGADSASIVHDGGGSGLIVDGNISRTSRDDGIRNNAVKDAQIVNNYIVSPIAAAINIFNASVVDGNLIEVDNNPSDACIAITGGSEFSTISNNTIRVLTGNTAAVTAIRLDVSNCTVIGNTIQFATLQAHLGLTSLSLNSILITGNQFTHASGTTGSIGIVLTGSSTVSVSGNTFGAFETGISTGSGNRLSIIGNSFLSQVISINATGGSQLSMTDNNFASCGQGIVTTNTVALGDVSVAGNNFSVTDKEALSLQGVTRWTINDNVFFNCARQLNNTYAVILLTSTGAGFSTNNVISGNTIRRTTGFTFKYGIQENSANDGPTIVIGNRITNAATQNILLLHIDSGPIAPTGQRRFIEVDSNGVLFSTLLPAYPVGMLSDGGEDGIDGFPGVAGAAGIAGAAGSVGPAGIPGFDGEDGADGFPGVGMPGANGATGAQGPTGPAIFLVGDDATEPDLIPGPQGLTGSSVIGSTYLQSSFTVATGNWRLQVKELQMTNTNRATLQGTGRLSVIN